MWNYDIVPAGAIKEQNCIVVGFFQPSFVCFHVKGRLIVVGREYSFPEKLSLCKKARRCDQERFKQLCRQYAISIEQLSLWFDSYMAGGEMGLRALDEVIDPPEEEIERALNVVRLYLGYKFPRRKFVIKKRRNKIYINHEPEQGHTAEADQQPVFQIRYFETKSKKPLWLLYWSRPDGKWWPYITSKQRIYKIDQLMEEVVNDPNHCFWSS